MADASSAILFIIELRRASMENWVKYAILHVRMSLSLGFRFQVVGEMQGSNNPAGYASYETDKSNLPVSELVAKCQPFFFN